MADKRLVPFPLLVAVVLVSACAAPIQTVDFDPAASGPVEQVRILPMEPTELRSQVFGNPVKYMGLIGRTLATATDSGRQRELREKLEGIDIDARFSQALEAELLARGLTVAWETGYEGDRGQFGLYEAYTPAAGDGAVQLDLALQFVGFAASGVGEENPYFPTVSANVRFVDASGETVLFQNSFNYHDVLGGEDSIVIEPDPGHAYATFGDLREADPEVLVEALYAALDAVAASIADRF